MIGPAFVVGCDARVSKWCAETSAIGMTASHARERAERLQWRFDGEKATCPSCKLDQEEEA